MTHRVIMIVMRVSKTHVIAAILIFFLPLCGCRQAVIEPSEIPQIAPYSAMAEMHQTRLLVRSLLYRHGTYLTPAQIERLAGRIVQWSHAANFDPLFVLAIIKVESDFQPRAESYAGAGGLMQILPWVADAEARRLGYTDAHDLHPDGIWDLEVNLRLGIHYLGRLRDRFGEDELFVAAYNMGPTLLAARLRQGIRPLGQYHALVRVAYLQMLAARRQYDAAGGSANSTFLEAETGHRQTPGFDRLMR